MIRKAVAALQVKRIYTPRQRIYIGLILNGDGPSTVAGRSHCFISATSRGCATSVESDFGVSYQSTASVRPAITRSECPRVIRAPSAESCSRPWGPAETASDPLAAANWTELRIKSNAQIVPRRCCPLLESKRSIRCSLSFRPKGESMGKPLVLFSGTQVAILTLGAK